MTTDESTLDDVMSEWPRWHCWRGVNQLVYASRAKTSPPAVVRGEDALDLRDQINRWEHLNEP